MRPWLYPSFPEYPVLWTGSPQLVFALTAKPPAHSWPCLFIHASKIPPCDCWSHCLRKVLALKAVGNQQPLRLWFWQRAAGRERVVFGRALSIVISLCQEATCFSLSSGTPLSVVLSSHPSHGQSMRVCLPEERTSKHPEFDPLTFLPCLFAESYQR